MYGARVQQIVYVSTYVRLVKQVVDTIFFQRTLTYVKESSIAYQGLSLKFPICAARPKLGISELLSRGFGDLL